MEENNENKNTDKLLFPLGFLWGSATSAHQVEGGTLNNWSEWEKKSAQHLAKKSRNYWQDWQKNKFTEMFEPENYISGRACDHYNRYEEDFELARSLGHNAHRFSIEWSRIEPEEGKFDDQEINHYRKVLEDLQAKGLEPFVTLWHWTNPVWLEKKGGCAGKNFPFYFSRYVREVVLRLGNRAKFWMTINEPTSVIAAAYIRGKWPPQKRNVFSALSVYKNLAKAHNDAYDMIHAVAENCQVGFANILQSFEPYKKNSWLDRLAVGIGDYYSNKKMLNLTKGRNDFLTIQYYFHNRLKFPRKVHLGDKPVSDLNWEIYPKGIYNIIMWLRKYNLPIYITENGLADADDSKRAKFIKEHLYWVHKAISEGADVRGYFYWSLLDNFEWDKGFWPRFGLVEVDYKTLERRIRPSAWEYKRIIENNRLPAEEK